MTFAFKSVFTITSQIKSTKLPFKKMSDKRQSQWSVSAHFQERLQPPTRRCQLAATLLTIGDSAIWQSARADNGWKTGAIERKRVAKAIALARVSRAAHTRTMAKL